jgi:hypothetical protein
MNARALTLPVLIAAALLVSAAGPARAGRTIGGGIHYLRNLGDITNSGTIDLDQNSYSLLASIKNDMGMLKVDGQVEYIFDHVGTGHEMWQPSVWLLAGGMVYGGAGIGIGYTHGAWQANPFYALRAGAEIPLGGLALDAYGTYQFQSDAELKSLTGEDLDSVTFAALLRFGF